MIRSCRPVISSQVKEHLPLHRSRSIRCIDRVTFALPPTSTRGINKQPGDGRTTSVPIPEAFSDRSRIKCKYSIPEESVFGEPRALGVRRFRCLLFRSMNRYCEGAANQSHFSEKSIGLEISSCSFIPSFKESEMAWQQA